MGLTVQLFNLSPQPSMAPDDLLCSYFFDIIDNGSRPSLNYISAVGNVFLAKKNFPDELITPNANIKAIGSGDRTWQFRRLDSMLTPFLGFGIGTVGNSNLTPNNFNGNVVGGMDFSIYTGDVATQNLNNRLYIKDMATFTFAGLTGFDEADILQSHAFGMGTAPDRILTPEPAAITLLTLGGLFLAARKQ